jgi:GR25 family glycosyltransferase involved in LPS biosynthesis
MQVNLISTSDEIGDLRRKILLPKLKQFKIVYKLYMGDSPKKSHNSINLWETIKEIIRDNEQSEYVVIMEDDCTFNNDNCKEQLLTMIERVRSSNVKAIFTGCSKVTHSNEKLSGNLISINSAHNSQLVVIFNSLYEKLLSYPSGGNWDVVLSSMSQLENTKVGLTLPFLTGQLKTGLSNLNNKKLEEIGERFEIEEQRLLKIFKNEK